MNKKELGLFHIYTGDGKGKTTAALGLSMRALGHEMRVYFGQFMKRGQTGEFKALSRFGERAKIEQFGNGRFLLPGKAIPSAEIRRAAHGLDCIRSAMQSGDFDLVVCDEINTAVAAGLLSESQVLDLVMSRPKGVELIFTGRNAPSSFVREADLVSEIKEVKHYFRKGVKARRGIEK